MTINVLLSTETGQIKPCFYTFSIYPVSKPPPIVLLKIPMIMPDLPASNCAIPGGGPQPHLARITDQNSLPNPCRRRGSGLAGKAAPDNQQINISRWQAGSLHRRIARRHLHLVPPIGCQLHNEGLSLSVLFFLQRKLHIDHIQPAAELKPQITGSPDRHKSTRPVQTN